MRVKNKFVYGIGVNDYEGSVKENMAVIKSYAVWIDMLRRCYSTKFQVKNPTYVGCTVAPEWLYFSNFKEWFDANYREGFPLDKDILVEGNKIYSPETCRFVPENINLLMNDNKRIRGNLPLGVSMNRNNYRASCWNGHGKQLSKTFKTIEEAQHWYTITKTAVVREVATGALLAGEIQQDIFDALVARKF